MAIVVGEGQGGLFERPRGGLGGCVEVEVPPARLSGGGARGEVEAGGDGRRVALLLEAREAGGQRLDRELDADGDGDGAAAGLQRLVDACRQVAAAGDALHGAGETVHVHRRAEVGGGGIHERLAAPGQPDAAGEHARCGGLGDGARCLAGGHEHAADADAAGDGALPGEDLGDGERRRARGAAEDYSGEGPPEPGEGGRARGHARRTLQATIFHPRPRQRSPPQGASVSNPGRQGRRLYAADEGACPW